MPITYEEAYNATNPADSDEQRKQSAEAIIAGTAANEAYWNSRNQLEALQARADGHGVVVRGEDENSPTQVAGGTQTPAAGTIEGTAVEEPTTALPEATSSEAVSPSPDNPVSAVSTLRKQLEDAGIQPEA